MAGGLGDEICLIPSYKALKEKYPNCEIHAKVRFREILIGNPYVDKLIRQDTILNRKEYDFHRFVFWELSNKHLIDVYAKQLKVDIEDRNININLNEDDYKKIENINFPKDKFKICFDTFASIPANRIDEIVFEKAIAYLKRTYDCVIYQIGHKTRFLDIGHNFIKVLNIREMAALIEKCDLFIGNNSGAFHLSSSMKTPTLTFFTATNSECYIHNDKNFCLNADIECKGCLNNLKGKSPVANKEEDCPGQKHFCKKYITPEDIVEKFKEIKDLL